MPRLFKDHNSWPHSWSRGHLFGLVTLTFHRANAWPNQLLSGQLKHRSVSLSPALAPDLTPALIHLSYIPNQSFRPKTHSQGRCINKTRTVWHTHINTHTCKRNPDLCIALPWHITSDPNKANKPTSPCSYRDQSSHLRLFSRNNSPFILNQAFSTSFYLKKPIQYFREMHFSHLFQISRGRTQTGIPIMLARWTAVEIRNLPFHHFPQAQKKKKRKKDSKLNAEELLMWIQFWAESCWTFSLIYWAQSSCLFRVKGTEKKNK